MLSRIRRIDLEAQPHGSPLLTNSGNVLLRLDLKTSGMLAVGTLGLTLQARIGSSAR